MSPFGPRQLFIAALIYLVISLVCTQIPLLNYLGYEFSLLVAFLGSVISGPKLELEAVRGLLASARHHHARIVEQKVEPVEPVDERGDEITDGAEVRQVEQLQLDGGVGRGLENGRDGLVASRLAATGDDDRRPLERQRLGSLEADATIGACDDRHAPGLVLDVGGGPAFLGHVASPFLAL